MRVARGQAKLTCVICVIWICVVTLQPVDWKATWGVMELLTVDVS